jgi:ribonuclease R
MKTNPKRLEQAIRRRQRPHPSEAAQRAAGAARPGSTGGPPSPAAAPSRAQLPAADLQAEAMNRAFESGAVPERAAILAGLAEAAVPLDEASLALLLGVSEPLAREGLRRRIAAMTRDGQLLINRKGFILAAERTNLVAGRVEAHPDGFGFVVPEQGEDLFIAPRDMSQVFHGDRVLARPAGLDRRGRPQGSIVQVLERAQTRIVGRVHVEHGVAYVLASDRRIRQDILLENNALGDARAGQIVTVEIVVQPSSHAQPIGRVVEVLGEELDPGMEIEIALRKHQLPFEFPAAVLAETRRLPEAVRRSDLRGREDLRDLAFVTIDGETARDFDDAVHVQKRTGGFTLRVAIADVAHYVREGSALDEEARLRGTSVYFPRRVIPMLPERLSNGLCSLNPAVDRLVLVCEMALTRQGRITEYRFYPAVIHSRARLTYEQVARSLYGLESPGEPVPQALLPELRLLDAAYKALAGQRSRRGAIDFSSREVEFEFDPHGRIASIAPAERNEAYRLIEECMLAANVCAAQFLLENEQPALFRNHAGPTEEKLEVLRSFLKPLGLQLGGASEPQSQDYAGLIAALKARPDAQLLEMVLLRSMQQARYAPENIGHFGLAFPAYAHFTSPIRRYPDLLVHRGIRAVLTGQRYRAQEGSADRYWAQLGEHCSLTERRADEAAREVTQWLRCFYMRDRVGETFAGLISAVTSFGIFVTLEGIFVDGLVHISELGNDYFDFDPRRYELRGSRSQRSFRLAQRLNVELVRVDLDLARIDFRLASSE